MGPFKSIKYVNNFGGSIELTDWPYIIQSESIFDYAWNYKATESNQKGGKISTIYRNVVEKDLDIAIHAASETAFFEALENFFNIAERDVLANTPGRLVLDDDQYMTGYILSSDNQRWNQGIRTDLKGVKFVSEYPFWCRDNLTEFHGTAGGSAIEYEYLDYNYDYEYDYYPADISSVLVNNFIGETAFELRIYGPATNPTIQIGSNTYQLAANIAQGDTLIINSKEKTIINYHADGTRDNLINDRTEGIFNPIPPGRLSVAKNMAAFDIVLYEERSEPEWISS